MPSYIREDGKPIIQFDASVEISPLALLRALRSAHPPLLVDGRAASPNRRSLAGAQPFPGVGWRPDSDEQAVVVFDDDGEEALEWVQTLRKEGYSRVRLLFGGLDLYEFSLDPEVTMQDTFLVRP